MHSVFAVAGLPLLFFRSCCVYNHLSVVGEISLVFNLQDSHSSIAYPQKLKSSLYSPHFSKRNCGCWTEKLTQANYYKFQYLQPWYKRFPSALTLPILPSDSQPTCQALPTKNAFPHTVEMLSFPSLLTQGAFLHAGVLGCRHFAWFARATILASEEQLEQQAPVRL